ncbi:unnamed protein product [Rhodiola kirilowii]
MGVLSQKNTLNISPSPFSFHPSRTAVSLFTRRFDYGHRLLLTPAAYSLLDPPAEYMGLAIPHCHGRVFDFWLEFGDLPSPTMVANTPHAAVTLLKEGGEWDWFINPSATDYSE